MCGARARGFKALAENREARRDLLEGLLEPYIHSQDPNLNNFRTLSPRTLNALSFFYSSRAGICMTRELDVAGGSLRFPLFSSWFNGKGKTCRREGVTERMEIRVA